MRRPVEEHSKLSLGLISVTGIVAVLVAALLITSAGVGDVRYEAEFAQAAQISAGDAVTIAGVPVGTVDGARLEGDHIVVTMKIGKNVALGADTKASIKLTTLLGSRYIELRPIGRGSIPDHRIRISNTVVPYDLPQLLENTTTLFEQVDADKIGQLMTSLSNQLAGTPALIPQVLRNIQNLSSVLAERRGQIGSLLASTTQVTNVVRGQQADLGALVENGTAMLQEIVSRRAMVQQLFDATTKLVGQLHTIAVEDRPEIDKLITNLNAFLQTLANNDQLLRNSLQILPVPLRNFANATGSGNEMEFNAPAGPLIDSWMCAISGRAKQLSMPPYLRDCK
ncbi:MCE family protein [Nocardia miyunensis]|uniref:MCE family protein n=1 Tax=Nocardia miyunensis TaxID=282684 RepID=UPI00350E4AC7